MRTIYVLIATLIISLAATAQTPSFYDFTATTIDGATYSFNQLKGKKVMIVNVDVQDQLAPQYANLQELYNQYSNNNFVIIGFPTEDFDTQTAAQKAGDDGYRVLDYDVTFPIMEKTSVKGDNISPIYQWLTEKTLNGVENAPVTGNFQKFLINENGQWAAVFAPDINPFNVKILNWISGQ